MKTIKRSELLSLPTSLALPSFEANDLRDYKGTGPVKVWLDTDGTACCCMFPHQTEADFAPADDGQTGAWVDVELDEPSTIETVNEMAARDWLARLRCMT